MATDFDPIHCAELHNKIVTATYNSTITKPYTIKPFFEAYPDWEEHYDNVPEEPKLTEFLARILVIRSEEDRDATVGFTPELAMPHPATFWKFSDTLDELTGYQAFSDEDESGGEEMGKLSFRTAGNLANSVLLYSQSSNSAMQDGGLYFDISTHLCRIVDRLVDCNDGFPEQNWLPLDRMLQRYLELYHIGMFHTSMECWPNVKWEPYAHHDLLRTLSAWDTLVDQIQRRRRVLMENQDFTVDSRDTVDTEQGMVDVETLARWQFNGFLKNFLIRAKPAPFKYIAPGITFLSSTLLNTWMEHFKVPEPAIRSDMIYFDNQSAPFNGYGAPPILFPRAIDDPLTSGETMNGFIFSDKAGIYMTALHYGFGDVIEFLSTWPQEDSRIEVAPLQHGKYCPYFSRHNVRLFTLLEKWTSMVQDGVFVVGVNGVEGGIEFWRRVWIADSAWVDMGRCWDS